MPNSNPEHVLRRVMKVYVAGSSAEIYRAELAINLLVHSGVAVTSTWPAIVRATGDANPTEATRDERIAWGVEDLRQVRESDLVWFLVPPVTVPTRGAWVEAGYAMGLGKIVLFSGPTKQSIFSALGYEFADDAEARALILRIADEDSRSVAFEDARRDAQQWKLTAQMLAQRLRNLRGVADDAIDRVLAGDPISEAARG